MDLELPTPAAGHGRIDDIEVLRAFAIGLVLVEHVRLNLLPWVSGEREWLYLHFGFWSGVDLFLAISGFVIARSLLPQLAEARDRVAYFGVALSFWVRRAWRLLPSAWLWLGVILAGSALFNQSGAFEPWPATLRSGVAAVLNLANFRIAHVLGRAPTGAAFHYWSLSLEEQFYLLFPFLVFVARRRLAWVLLALAAAQLFFTRYGPHSHALMNMTKSDALALGVLVAIWTGRASYGRLEPTVLQSRVLRYALPLAFLLAFSALTGRAWGPQAFLVGAAAVMGAAIVWVASYDRDYLFPPGRLKRLLCWLGARSYGVYLIHVPAFLATKEIWFRANPFNLDPTPRDAALLLGTGFGLLFLLAELNYRLVETPLRRHGARIAENMRRRSLARADAVPAPEAPAIDEPAQLRA